MSRGKPIAFRGVTLVEMMIVVGIVGVIASLAVPNLGPVVKQQKIKGKTEEAAALVDRARRLAHATGRCHAVTVVGVNLVLQETTGTEAANCVDLTTPGWSTIARVVPDGGTVFTINAGSDPIIMRPNGRLRGNANLSVTDDQARIDISHPALDRGWLVKVTPLGRVCKSAWLGSIPATSTPEVCP
jgi:prepilin-type N-terminal cleavage/methylation domain-containing protein